MEGNVIHTNVLISANGIDTHAPLKCQSECIELLEQIKSEKKLILLDSDRDIFDEYQRYCDLSGKPGVGDFFFKWLHDHSADASRVRSIDAKKSDQDDIVYEILKDIECLAGFDRSDRKFLAVAMTYEGQAVIHNATDSDWHAHRDCIAGIEGVSFNQLCPSIFQNQ